MRIVVVHPGPLFSVADVYAGWVEALRKLGHQVFEFNLGDRMAFYDGAALEVDGEYRKALGLEEAARLAVNGLAAALYRIQPHILLSVSSFFVDPEILEIARKRGTRVVLLHTEAPYENDRQMKIAPYADLNLLNDPTGIEQFEALAPTVYAPHAYRETVHYRGASPRDVDFFFVGTGYQSRVEFFESFDFSGIDARLAGNWMRLPDGHELRGRVMHSIDSCFDNAEAAPMYRRAKVGLNLYRREANAPELIPGWAMGPREVEMAACGLFFLRDPRPEGDDVLSMLPTFVGGENASDLVRYYLAHDSEREKLAALAAEAIADRTFTNHAAMMLRLFEPKE